MRAAFLTRRRLRDHSLSPSPGRLSSAGARAPSAPDRRLDRTLQRWPESPRLCGPYYTKKQKTKQNTLRSLQYLPSQTQTLILHLNNCKLVAAAEVCSPFQILTELIKVQLPPGLTQTVGNVVHSRLLQSQLHQSFVTTLRERLVNSARCTVNVMSSADNRKSSKEVYRIAILYIWLFLKYSYGMLLKKMFEINN